MKNEVQVLFFDLFYTLVEPRYSHLRNEFDVLKMSVVEWEMYAECIELYTNRAIGKEKSPLKIIEGIVQKMNIAVNEIEIKEVLQLREERFKKSLIEVEPIILEVLSNLKKNGLKLCLISNADVIDVMHWQKSPLSNLFDETVFSFEVGYVKPQPEIYEIALKRMKANPYNCFFVGDGGSDELKGAKQVGMKTIMTSHLLKRERQECEVIREFADYCVEDFREIMTIILL